jgi:uncharacterized protein with FMN-binding domain
VSITPPQFGSSGGLGSLGSKSTSTTPSASASAQTTTTTPATPAQPTPTTAAKKKKTTKKAASPGAANTTTAPAQTQAPAPQSAGVSGTFTGDAAQTAYGPVQVQVTVSNGKITRVSAPVYPTNSFRDQSINSQAIPLLIQQVMQAQSSNIQGVGGASYTSQGFYDSLITALKKAGM